MNAKEWIEYLRYAGELNPSQKTSLNQRVQPRIDRKGVESGETVPALTGSVQIPAIPARSPYNCFGLEKYFCSVFPVNAEENVFYGRAIDELLAGIAGKSVAEGLTGFAVASVIDLWPTWRCMLVLLLPVQTGPSGFGRN
jgi:hypothetical protein